MGCCQSNPPLSENESAFSDFTKSQSNTKENAHAYTLSSTNKTKTTEKKTTNQYYASRQIKPTQSSATTNTEKAVSASSLSNGDDDSTKELIKNKEKISTPLPYDKLDKNRLSPNKHNHILNVEETEFSVSKSRKSQYRKRTEPQSPSNELIKNMNAEIMNDNEPQSPILDEMDNASNASSVSSDNVEIPGLKEIVFGDEEDDASDDEEDDFSLNAIAFLVQQENERIAREIERMQSHISEQETIKLKREAMDEVMAEMKKQQKEEQNEDLKRQKAMERYEKKQRQRLKEKEEAKEKRRKEAEERKAMKKEQMLKKQKQKELRKERELEIERRKEAALKRKEERQRQKNELEYCKSLNMRPSKEQIGKLFEKFMLRPFEEEKNVIREKYKNWKKTMDEKTQKQYWYNTKTRETQWDNPMLQEEEFVNFEDESSVNYKAFEHGMNALGMGDIMNGDEIKCVFEHIANPYFSINADDFAYFLKSDSDKMDSKMSDMRLKMLSVMRKMEDIEDEQEEIAEMLPQSLSNKDMVIPDAPRVTITISQPILIDIPNMNIDSDFDDEDSDDEEDEDEEMSMSMPNNVILSDLPRASFKQISYDWSDNMSTKTFNKYKKMRGKFANRYQHSPRKTMDEELNKRHSAFFEKKLSEKDINNKENIQTMEDPKQQKSYTKSMVFDVDEVINAVEKTEQKSEEKKIQITTTLVDIDEDNEMKKEERVPNIRNTDEIDSLRKLYMEQHKMKQKLDRLRKKSLLNFPSPPKPKDISPFINDKVKYICKELKLCIQKNTRYTGLGNFGPNGELGIEIEFTSNCDDDGYMTGNRVYNFKKGKVTKGNGRIWNDVYWNGHKFEGCTKFEYMDEANNVTTKFEFDSYKNEIDVDHSFFQGTIKRYPSNLDPTKRNTKLIMHEGYFDFICVSARRRNIRKNSFVTYHNLDVDGMDKDELEKLPKYVRRMSAYTDKIDQLYDSNKLEETRDTLFGDAIATVTAIVEQDQMSPDAPMPSPDE